MTYLHPKCYFSGSRPPVFLSSCCQPHRSSHFYLKPRASGPHPYTNQPDESLLPFPGSLPLCPAGRPFPARPRFGAGHHCGGGRTHRQEGAPPGRVRATTSHVLHSPTRCHFTRAATSHMLSSPTCNYVQHAAKAPVCFGTLMPHPYPAPSTCNTATITTASITPLSIWQILPSSRHHRHHLPPSL